MKIVIYYFTGTGNSLSLARDLTKELHDDVELVPIAKLTKEKSIRLDSDIVGIVYPTWFHSIPPIVNEFAEKLISSNSYIFGICTYYVQPYNSLFDLNAILEKKGMKLAAGFSIQMPGKYVLLKELTSSEEEKEGFFNIEKEKIKEIARSLKEKKYIGIEGTFDESENGDMIKYHTDIYKAAEKFWVTDKCNSCSECVKICPRNNISIEDNKVLWNDNCDICLACLHWCPQAAIQNGDISSTSRRYHHPDITTMDIINQN